jgi:hypothetical protein
MKEADLAAKASNLDVATWRNLQEKFPTVFEKARAAKINDMINNSSNPVSGFNDGRFLKQWEGMDKEMREVLFSPEMQAHIDAFRTVRQAIPPKLGPSGTPEGEMMMQMFNPKRNALDFGVKKTLDAVSSGKSAAARAVKPTATASKTSAVSNSLTSRPEYSGSFRPKFDRPPPGKRVGEEEKRESQPTKGPDKWANDGAEKLKEHSRDPASIDSLRAKAKDDPKLRELFAIASDLKPGSKAMENILERIKKHGNAPSKH